MKLIMENWRHYLNEEEQLVIRTVGELRSLFKGAIAAKRKATLSGKAGITTAAEVGAEATLAGLGMIPIIGNIASGVQIGAIIAKLIRKVYWLPDEKKTNTGLDHLNVDDEISAIVDNDVETAFLNAIIKEISQYPDETKLENTNMTALLKKYLHKEFDGRSVRGGEGQFALQSKDPSIVNIAKQTATPTAVVPKK